MAVAKGWDRKEDELKVGGRRRGGLKARARDGVRRGGQPGRADKTELDGGPQTALMVVAVFKGGRREKQEKNDETDKWEIEKEGDGDCES